MGQWEYTTSVITHGFMGRQSDELNRKELEKALNELGAAGWELATAFLDTEPAPREGRPRPALQALDGVVLAAIHGRA